MKPLQNPDTSLEAKTQEGLGYDFSMIVLQSEQSMGNSAHDNHFPMVDQSQLD